MAVGMILVTQVPAVGFGLRCAAVLDAGKVAKSCQELVVPSFEAPLEIDFVSGPRMGERHALAHVRTPLEIRQTLWAIGRLLLTEQVCTIGRAETCTVQAGIGLFNRCIQYQMPHVRRSATPCLQMSRGNTAYCREQQRVT